MCNCGSIGGIADRLDMVQDPKNMTQTIVSFKINTLPLGDILGNGLGSDTRRAECNFT